MLNKSSGFHDQRGYGGAAPHEDPLLSLHYVLRYACPGLSAALYRLAFCKTAFSFVQMDLAGVRAGAVIPAICPKIGNL